MSGFVESAAGQAPDRPYPPIAIVSYAIRFPGDLATGDVLWDALKTGRDMVSQVPADRWAVDTLQHGKRSEPGRSVTFSAGIISRIDEFDAEFFGISPREAAWVDPQQRLLLELAWEAMENAYVAPPELAGTDCAVYLGISSLDYGIRGLDDLAAMSSYSMTGNTLSVAANRLSYVFDLRGPSMAIDTACSSSLVALDQACRALQSGQARAALVGGVNLLLHPHAFVGFTKASMLSADGRCRPFDADGRGYVRAEGGAVLLLKPLQAALDDGDKIEAIILGSGVNADGSQKTAMTIPSTAGQADLMRRVLAQTGLDAGDIDFIEAHGTGTAVGDPVEVSAIAEVYGSKRDTPLPIGSIKANLGHLEPASGMAGLIKTVLALQNKALPAQIHLNALNPNIDFKALNVEPVRRYREFAKPGNAPLVAGVNSFGFGGANAHVVLQEFCENRAQPQACPQQSLPVLTLSAKSKPALAAMARRYADFLTGKSAQDYYDIAYGAAHGRAHLEKRLAVIASTPAQAVETLADFARGITSDGLLQEDILPQSGTIAFVYSGNGAQWIGMGLRLVSESPRFAQIISELDAAIAPVAGFSILDELQADPETSRLSDTEVAQPTLFALQAAITLLLKERGMQPQAVCGHSVGEVAAAWAAGALELNEAIRVIVARSRAQGTTRGAGRMAAAAVSLDTLQRNMDELEALSRLAGDPGDVLDVVVAGINSPKQLTLAGNVEHLQRLGNHLKQQGVFFQLLELDYAFHSVAMDPIEAPLLDSLANLHAGPASKASFVSTVTGQVMAGEALDANYWWRNVRRPVRFADAIETLATQGCRIFVEIGPHAILQSYIRDCLAAADVKGKALGVLRKNADGLNQFVETALRVQLLASQPDWSAQFPQPGRRVRLPNYPWQRERHWHPVTSESLSSISRKRVNPLLGWRVPEAEFTWENIVDGDVAPWLSDHKVGDAVVFPGSAYAEMALAAAREWLGEQQIGIEDLDIMVPMVFDAEHARRLRFVLNARDGGFRIMSRQRLSEDAWMLHAAGRIWAADDSVNAKTIEGVPIDATVIDAQAHYALARNVGLNYGPAFQRLAYARISDDRLEIELDEPPDGEDWLLHPAQVDICFQSLLHFFNSEIKAGHGVAMLPIKIGRVLLYQPGVASFLRGRLCRRSARTMVADFEVLDAYGTLLASLTGCRFRAAPLVSPHQKDKVALWDIQRSLCPHPAESRQIKLPDSRRTVAHIREAIGHHTAQRHRWYREALPLLEALVISFGWQACRKIEQSNAGLQTLAHARHPFTRWLLALMRREGLLLEQDGQLSLAADNPLAPPDAIWRSLLCEHPACLPQLTLISHAGSRLAAFLQERDDAARHSFAANLWGSAVAEVLYEDDPAYAGTAAAIEQAIQLINAELPPGRRLRVLEVTAGPTRLARSLLQAMPEDRIDYVLALADESLAQRQRTVYADFANVTVATLKSADWSLDCGVALPEAFDIVIFRHVLHKAATPALGLVNAKRWLAEGGRLIVAERHADWSADFLHGFDDSWWHENVDASGEPQVFSSLLPPAAWKNALDRQGFDDVQALAEPAAEGMAAGSYLLLARNPSLSLPEAAPEQRTSWLLMVDDTSLHTGERLRSHLEDRNQLVLLEQDDVESSLPGVRNVVWLRGWGASAGKASAALSDLLDTVQKLAAGQADSQRIWIVTWGSRAHAAQAALWGFGRVVMNEHPRLACTLIDVADVPGTQRLEARLANELLHPDVETEVLLDVDARYTLRMRHRSHALIAASRDEAADAATERFRLDFLIPGQLRNLTWLPHPALPLEDDEIEARPCATGLNFRDIMYVMGLLPDEAVENGFAGPSLGLEFSGIVTRVGAGRHDLRVGDKVMGFGPACFASHVITRANAVARIPDHWSFESAATIPTVFLTVYYALVQLAQLEPGERVLIHGGAGGVGIAAIQLARHLGAQVFATAGSEEKRDFVRLLGADHVFDSRSFAFEDEIMAATAGEGVDVVLNSLAGEAVRRSMRVLRPFGRFLELGKRDFFENTPIGLRPFKDNVSYFGIDADQLLTGKPKLAAGLFAEVIELFKSGVLTPLPYRTFPADSVIDAFRYMQQARHIGKVIVSMDGARPRIQEPGVQAPPLHLTTGATWLVTGGLSGFGLESARWLARNGAGHIVLVSRRGPGTPGADDALEELAALGVQARAIACDVADPEAVADVFRQIAESFPPVKGVLHAAMVIDDRLIADIDAASIDAVLRPKLTGAWNLHQATKSMALDHFILYSSITTSIGNPGQGTYVAANSALEALAEHRRSQGLPAVCIGWGPIGDVGYLTRNTAVRKSLAHRLGAEPLSAAQALDALGRLLDQNVTVSAANFNWSRLSGLLPSASSPRFDVLNREFKDTDVLSDDTDIRALIEGRTPDEAASLVQRLVIDEAARIMAADAARIDPARSLHELGLDSLMAVELALGLEQRFGIELPVMMLNESPTVEKVSRRIVGQLLGAREESESGDGAVENLIKTVAGQHEVALGQDALQGIALRAREISLQNSGLSA